MEDKRTHFREEIHTMGKREREQKKSKKGGILVAIVIAILIGIIIYLLLPREEDDRRNVVVTPDNVESVLEKADEAVPDGYYTVTMNPTWHFASGSEASYDAVVENVAENTNDVYFDIVLEADEENVLYKSPVIPRGSRLEEITLDETLDAGTYPCVVIYNLVDEDQNTLSTLRVGLEIVIEG